MKIEQTNVFAKWLRRCRDKRAKAIIQRHIDQMMSGDLQQTKFVGDGVWERKINYGPGYRLYYTLVGKRVILLLCGGDKSTQQRDIARAKKIKKGKL